MCKRNAVALEQSYFTDFNVSQVNQADIALNSYTLLVGCSMV